jgi:hypothetical protein
MAFRRLVLAAIPAAAIPVVLASPADAAVPATPEQLTELTHAALSANYLEVPNDRAVLSEARFSSVDPTWAAAQVAYPGLHEHRHHGRRDLTYTYPVTEGLALFVLRPYGEWVMPLSPDQGCGTGAGDREVPVAVQLDLALPTCDLDGAALGEEVFVRDARGEWKSEPRTLVLSIGAARVRINGLKWFLWDVNRAASTFHTRGVVPGQGVVDVLLRGYTHCEGRVSYRSIAIIGLKLHGIRKGRRFLLPCPTPDYEPQPTPVAP